MNEHPQPVAAALPPVQWLRTFLAVVQAGSFSEAAQQLNMTQAAVSRHVRLLEHRLGAALFDRHARGVAPTVVAESMLPRVRQAFALLEVASAEVISQRGVHLRCDITWAEAVLSRQLRTFCVTHPDIRLQVSNFVWPEASPALDADLYVLIGAGELPGFRRTVLTRETAFVVATPELADEFRARPHSVTWLTRIGQESAWQRWSARHADQPLGASRIICDSSIVTRAAALADQGLVMLRASQCHVDIEQGSLVRIDDFAEDLDEGYYLYQRELEMQSTAARTVADWLVEIGVITDRHSR